LLGGFLAVARIATFSYWADSYWGGAVAGLGGALVLGALPRLKKNVRVRYALLMGLGLAVLANSRPYEGLVFSLPVAIALFAWMLGKDRPSFSISMRRVVVPLVLLLAMTGGWMAYYNWRVTGNPVRMPYQVYQTQYDPTPYFLWQSQKPLPEYRHAEMKAWETEIDLGTFKSTRTAGGLISEEIYKGMSIWVFYIGPLFTALIVFVLLTLPYGYSWKDISGPTKFLLLAFAMSLAAGGLEVYFYPQYLAPFTCVFFALILIVMRHLWTHRWRGNPTGMSLVRLVLALTAFLMLLRVAKSPIHLRTELAFTPWFSHSDRTSPAGRQPILSQLEQQPGSHVVLVRYLPDLYNLDLHRNEMWPPSGVWEWVYNSADIDQQRIIWAHDMGPTENAELIHYYPHRQVWLLEADEQPPKLKPYLEPAGGDRQPSEEKVLEGSKSSVK
jgi:hypothetical protein